jgi:hypothetical protein
MEGGIFLCHWYFLLKAYLQRRRQQNAGNEIDKPEETIESGGGKEGGSKAPQTDIPPNPLFRATSPEDV